MIILKHLTVENFGLLREIDLHFPQRGSILIQGPNESGKSTLFESIYFALYGDPLIPIPSSSWNPYTPAQRTVDDLVFYGAARATVTLTLSVSVTELTITRTIERGKPQKATLHVHRLGMPAEAPITNLTSVNERVTSELGHMDGETMRNFCFIEQKGLSRLESLRGSEREATLRKLLRLEKLTRLAEQFKMTDHDRQLLNESADHLQLAEIQARIPQLSERLATIEAALDAVTASEDLTTINQQEAEIAEQELSLEQIQTKRFELKSEQRRMQQLSKAEAILAESIATCNALAEAQRAIPELEQQIADLERREEEELPALEKQVQNLEELTRSFATLGHLAANSLAVSNMITGLEQEIEEQKVPIDTLALEALDEQIARAYAQTEQMRQTQAELDEEYSKRPRLEERLSRLQSLSEQLAAFQHGRQYYVENMQRYTEQLKQAALALAARVKQAELAEAKRIKQAQLIETARVKRAELAEAKRIKQAQLIETARVKRAELALAAQMKLRAEQKKRTELAEKYSKELADKQKELHETEQELGLLEAEAQQSQQRADAIEERWRQLSLRRQLEQLQRLKSPSQTLAEAEQQVVAAHQQQEQRTIEALTARRAAKLRIGYVIIGAVLTVVFASFAGIEFLGQVYIFATVMGILALLSIVGVGLSLQGYSKARKKERATDQLMQQAINQVGMMVAAREAAGHIDDKQETLPRVEREIRSFGGTVPQSFEEIQAFLQRIPDQGESLADMQQQMKKTRTDALTVSSRVQVTKEALAGLRKDYARLEAQDKYSTIDTNKEYALLEEPDTNKEYTLLEELDKYSPVDTDEEQDKHDDLDMNEDYAFLEEQDKYDDLDINTETFQTNVQPPPDTVLLEQLYQKIASLASQEGLSMPDFDTLMGAGEPEKENVDSTPQNTASLPSQEAFLELNALVTAALKDSERMLVTISTKLEILPDIAEQLTVCQNALDALFARKHAMVERQKHFQAPNLLQQIERAREQEIALGEALHSLQDALRLRVQPLGIPFSHAAVQNAEADARKQIELVRSVLGNRVELQNRRLAYISGLEEYQESLSAYYRQMGTFSSSLGSWIVPVNLFIESFVESHSRCRQELEAIDEDTILSNLEESQLQEGASRAKIGLCLQEIQEAQGRVASILVQHNRPSAKGYTFSDIVTVWPLVGEYSPQDRNQLQEEREVLEPELHQLEQQELELSAQLQVDDHKLDLEQAHLQMDLQERNYQAKKYGGVMVKALSDRLIRKMQPRTEYYMHQLVPLLTCGRYREVRLTTNPEEGSASGGAFQLHIWESAAGEYLPKSALSSGTSDQLSLALRLAFAIATLPPELATVPGFMLLDEPLSSLDRTHTQALVDIITGEMLGEHFEQVLLMSHSSAFDPAMFPYHIYMDGGLVVESNLPTGMKDSSDTRLRIPAITLNRGS